MRMLASRRRRVRKHQNFDLESCKSGRMGRLRTPGPGSYDVPAHLMIGGNTTKKATASFASNSKRGADAKRDLSGDPGAYDIERVGVHLGRKEPMSARSGRSFNRDVNSGRGSFNSTTSRSTSAPPRSQRGGPGEHDYSHLCTADSNANHVAMLLYLPTGVCAHVDTCGNASTHMTSSFLSASPLAGHIRRSDTPGVGEYEPTHAQSKNFSKAGSHMFAGSLQSRSSAARSTTGEDVGPGSYELEQSSIHHQMAIATNPRLCARPSMLSRSLHSVPV